MKILISEVGPRDGLQNVAAVMPTAAKKAWIDALVAAGIREIEVGSFVPPSLIPQLADTREIVAHALKHPGLTVAALVPNARGAADALDAGVHKISIPLSLSETHSLRNVRRTHAQMLEEVAAIAALIADLPKDRRPHFEGALSTAFGCTLEGPIPDATLLAMGAALMERGCDEVGLSDTTGYATPGEVRRLVALLRAEVGDAAVTGLHLHNTRGLGLANVLAGLDMGISTFDASIGGLGGCPFAPGASGNIVTEDLVFMLEAMGHDTGIDISRLLACRPIITAAFPDEPLYGFIADAGLPLGWEPRVRDNSERAAR
jgi:hydroxymethylglutaryl-CoA lyase